MSWWKRDKSEPTAAPAPAELPEWTEPPTDIDDFRDRLEAVGLGHLTDDLVALVRPSCRLVPDPSIDSPTAGASRLGGVPDLPPGTEWPTGPDAPLSFVAQINLADVAEVMPSSGLPASGLMAFFYDAVSQSAWGFAPGDDVSWSVIYTAESAVCVPATWPDSLSEEGRCRGVGLRMVHELAFPAAESFDVERLGIESPWSTYGRVLGEADDLVSRLLGNPDPVQGDMQVECQLASNGVYCGDGNYLKRPEAQSLIPGADSWRLLLQIDSHEDETGMMWGDVGRLYFWITEDDLALRKWGATWMVLQCG